MALILKPQFSYIDKSGKNIYVKETSGLYDATYNTGGFGLPNIDIDDIIKFVFTLSLYGSTDIFRLDELDKTKVISGQDIQLNSVNLSGAEIALQFDDGVYDLNEYVEVNDVFDLLQAEIGDDFILLSTPITEEYLSKYDAIIGSDDVIYQIDKSRIFVGTTIYLTTPLLATLTGFTICYKANTKFLNTREFDYLLGTYTTKVCCNGSNKTSVDILYHKIMAEMAMDRGDYAAANQLISETFNRYC